MAYKSGRYVPDDAISHQYRMSNALFDEPVSPGKYSFFGGLAQGLGSGYLASGARSGTESNQSLMAQTLKGVGNAKTLDDAQNTLLTSEIPSLQQSGAESRLKTLAEDPNKEYRIRAAQWAKMGYTPETAGYKDWVLTGKLPDASGGASAFGMTGQTFQGPDGRFFTVQFGRDGTRLILPVELPATEAAAGEGTVQLSPAKGISEVDTGTGTRVIDKATGKDVREISKDLRGAEAEKEIGTAVGKAAASAPSDIAAAESALELIESIRSDPNREAGTGLSSVQNMIRSTPGYDFQTKVDQAKSGAFLTAIQQMRGMGALSNAEGETATRAVTRMNTSTSEAEFLAALDDYEKVVRKGRAAAEKRLRAVDGMPVPPDKSGWSIQRIQ